MIIIGRCGEVCPTPDFIANGGDDFYPRAPVDSPKASDSSVYQENEGTSKELRDPAALC